MIHKDPPTIFIFQNTQILNFPIYINTLPENDPKHVTLRSVQTLAYYYSYYYYRE